MSKTAEKFGEILVEWGIITTREVAKAMEHAKAKGLRIGEALVDLKLCNENNVYKALVQQQNMEYVELDKEGISPNAITRSRRHHKKYMVIPLGMESGKLKFAIHDPLNLEMLDILPLPIEQGSPHRLASKARIKQILDGMFNTSDHQHIDKTMDRTIDRLRDSLDKSLDKSLDRSLDKSVDR